MEHIVDLVVADLQGLVFLLLQVLLMAATVEMEQLLRFQDHLQHILAVAAAVAELIQLAIRVEALLPEDLAAVELDML